MTLTCGLQQDTCDVRLNEMFQINEIGNEIILATL